MKLLITIIISLILSVQAYAISIYINSDQNIQFMLVDYNGKRTGYDPNAKQVISETGLPRIMYYLHNEYNPDNPPVNPDPPYYTLQGDFPVNQTPLNMKLILTANVLAKINEPISIEFEEKNTSISYPQNSVQVILPFLMTDIGLVSKYELSYIPFQSAKLTKISASNDLIADITTAQKLNLMGNAKFVSELTKDINEIEAEKAKGKIDDGLTPAQKAKKEYTELLKEITEKYNKSESDEFVKQEAYTILKEDLEYIINHL